MIRKWVWPGIPCLRVGLVSLPATALAICVLSGCITTYSSNTLPVPNRRGDSLSSTAYHGSDKHYHHFRVQQGMTAHNARVPVDEADVIPGAWPRHAKRIPDGVASAGDGQIVLIRGVTGQSLDPVPEFMPDDVDRQPDQ